MECFAWHHPNPTAVMTRKPVSASQQKLKRRVLAPLSLLRQSYDGAVLKAHYLLHSEISSMDGCNFCLIRKGSLEKGDAKAPINQFKRPATVS